MLNYVMNILHEYPVADPLRDPSRDHYKIQGYGNIDKNIAYIDAATVTNLIESAT